MPNLDQPLFHLEKKVRAALRAARDVSGIGAQGRLSDADLERLNADIKRFVRDEVVTHYVDLATAEPAGASRPIQSCPYPPNTQLDRAKRLLVHYFKEAADHAGMKWDRDNVVEVEDIVDQIAGAASAAAVNAMFETMRQDKG